MKCIVCNEPDSLEAYGFVPFTAPLAKKGGNIKTAGVKVTQLDIKAAWQMEPIEYDEGGNLIDEEGPPERGIRGPIRCKACGARLVLVCKEGANTLYEMDMEEAEELGIESF